MKAEKERNGQPAAPSAAKPKRRRDRKRATLPGVSTTPLEASEQCVARIDDLVTEVLALVRSTVEAQRAKPDRWDYFAALADLEARIRKVLP